MLRSAFITSALLIASAGCAKRDAAARAADSARQAAGATPTPTAVTPWLDADMTDWNGAAPTIPAAPAPLMDPPDIARCRDEKMGVRQPVSAADSAITARGWSLFIRPKQLGNATLIYAESSVDGMCRPMGFQAFIFVNGHYAGTLSPVPMQSRTDGAINEVTQVSSDSLVATYLRYTDQDPLCCASAQSTVRFTIRNTDTAPAVLAASVTKKPMPPM